MSGVLRAWSTVLGRPGRTKPTGAARIDWTHPLSRSIFDCLIFNDGGVPINLASPSAVTTLSGAPAYSDTSVGPAGYSTGGATYNIPDHGNIIAGDFTIRVRFVPVTWPGSFTTLFCKSNGSAREIGVFFSTSGDVDFADINGFQDGATVSTGMSAGGLWDFVFSRSGSTVSYYVNGAFIASRGGFSGTTTTGGFLKFGHDDKLGGIDPNTKYVDFQIWLRALGPDEIQQIYLDPYCFLLPAESEMPALLLAGSPNVSVTLTGVAATSAATLPTVTGFANVALPGAASTSAAGTLSVSGKANVTLTGVQSASAAGTLTITGSANVILTGALSVTASNAPTVTGKANVTLIGVSTSAAVGTLTVQTAGSTSTTLTGVQANGSAGTLTVQVQSASLDGGNGGTTGKKRRKPTKFVPIERPGLPPIDKPKERKPEIVQELPVIEADESAAVEAETINLDLLPLTPEQLIAAQAIDEADDEEVVSLLLDWMIENEAPVRATIANLLGDVLASL